MKIIKIFLLLFLLLFLISCVKNNIKIENNYAISMLKKGLVKEAEFHFRQLIKLNPNDWVAHNNLAVCLEQQGKYDEAQEEYEIALSLIENEGVKKNYKKFMEERSEDKK